MPEPFMLKNMPQTKLLSMFGREKIYLCIQDADNYKMLVLNTTQGYRTCKWDE